MQNINTVLFTELLEQKLSEAKPGYEAQRIMAPLFQNREYRSFTPTNDAKSSAVLLLLVFFEDTWQVLLTLRSEKLNSHKGQISFPGGRVEQGESFKETAVRETFEEVGLDASNYEILGSLSELFVPPSNTVIQPFVAAMFGKPELKINQSEVEEAFFIPLSKLMDDSYLKREDWTINGWTMEVPFWDIHPKTPLWGATAIMLSEFIEIFKTIWTSND